MPVRFEISPLADKVRPDAHSLVSTPEGLLKNTWGSKEGNNATGELLQSSLHQRDFSTIRSDCNGFVETIILAYSHHHHLILRSDQFYHDNL
jgi:hypothetical protein